MEWGSGKFSWLILYVLFDSTITKYCLLRFSFDLREEKLVVHKDKNYYKVFGENPKI